MDQEARPTEDTLFLALTRPALWLGVPLEAALLIAMASVLMLLLTSNPLYAIGLGGALLGAARLIVRTDYNMFRLIFLWGRTKTTPAQSDEAQPSNVDRTSLADEVRELELRQQLFD